LNLGKGQINFTSIRKSWSDQGKVDMIQLICHPTKLSSCFLKILKTYHRKILVPGVGLGYEGLKLQQAIVAKAMSSAPYAFWDLTCAQQD
jgi:hypothetical protein